jgi:hypothetical protein
MSWRRTMKMTVKNSTTKVKGEGACNVLRLVFFLVWSVFIVIPGMLVRATDLPVKNPTVDGYKENPYNGLVNLLDVNVLYDCIEDGNDKGLLLDLSGITSLLDGTVIGPTDKITGLAYLGPYPFESGEVQYTFKRFRLGASINQLQTVLPMNYFLLSNRNSEDWTSEGQVVVRLKLYFNDSKGARSIGKYDLLIRFRRVENPNAVENEPAVKFVKLTSLKEGPLVNLINSNDPSTAVITFRTDRPVKSAVVLNDGRRFDSAGSHEVHEIKLTGLKPVRVYSYHVEFEGFKSKRYTFRSAPRPGEGKVIFGYAGDSREGVGVGNSQFMGVNADILERCINTAYRLDADLFVFGGDLVSGYTTVKADMQTQLQGWKQVMSGFWHMRPVYTCIGNHEALLRTFVKPGGFQVSLDRWPYETDSIEAVFAGEMTNPVNGPGTSDPSRPSYKENVYSFQYGPVLFIAFNNNYWVSYNSGTADGPKFTGGCPEGYIMADQLQWIRRQLNEARQNDSVKYVVLFAQEPVFPNGGHVQDCMWYNGNNNVRAYTYKMTPDSPDGKIVPEKKGILDVRNQLAVMISQHKKVAAVLGSDEHSYHKVLIHREVPVGIPETDDKDGNGKIDVDGSESASPLKELKYPVWYLVSGGAGAPYYSEGPTPWNTYWKKSGNGWPKKDHSSRNGCYYYSSQPNFFLFEADDNGISLKVYNPYGEIIDSIDNLMLVKKKK